MSNMVNLKIDGKDVTVEEGTNLIDAAETVGVHIPNLCYMKGMKGSAPAGSAWSRLKAASAVIAATPRSRRA